MRKLCFTGCFRFLRGDFVCFLGMSRIYARWLCLCASNKLIINHTTSLCITVLPHSILSCQKDNHPITVQNEEENFQFRFTGPCVPAVVRSVMSPLVNASSLNNVIHVERFIGDIAPAVVCSVSSDVTFLVNGFPWITA